MIEFLLKSITIALMQCGFAYLFGYPGWFLLGLILGSVIIFASDGIHKSFRSSDKRNALR